MRATIVILICAALGAAQEVPAALRETYFRALAIFQFQEAQMERAKVTHDKAAAGLDAALVAMQKACPVGLDQRALQKLEIRCNDMARLRELQRECRCF